MSAPVEIGSRFVVENSTWRHFRLHMPRFDSLKLQFEKDGDYAGIYGAPAGGVGYDEFLEATEEALAKADRKGMAGQRGVQRTILHGEAIGITVLGKELQKATEPHVTENIPRPITRDQIEALGFTDPAEFRALIFGSDRMVFNYAPRAAYVGGNFFTGDGPNNPFFDFMARMYMPEVEGAADAIGRTVVGLSAHQN